ncbi:MAG: ABC transporter permease [Tenericutes bacterium]|nr:ABC transporter permease [Mycoplasmatota bacterium]
MRDFNYVDSSKKQDSEQIRESLTYWKDVWRRLKGNLLAMIGLGGVILVVLFGVVGPYLTPYGYQDQQNDYSNLPPKLTVYQISDENYVYLTQSYYLLLLNSDGELVGRLTNTSRDFVNRIYHYDFDGEDIAIDYSYRIYEPDGEIDYTVTYQGETTTLPTDKIQNKTFLLGSDHLGRDILTRLMYGARISLVISLVAAIVNLFIGVIYGAISGFASSRTDNIMMRVVDIINSIPLVIYVILLMVILDKSNIWTIILAIGTVYWVGMARLVRGQIISLKDQEFVLAARVIGVSQGKIIARHLIPNSLGPIIVSLTMSIPSAIFTEAFLSFIGIGISAPQASWGTMANEAIAQLEQYPYQMLLPALAIGITVLSFNFLGDGLRSALDPRLRKG